MYYIDTHFHADYEDIEEIVSDSYENGVEKLIISGSDVDSNEKVMGIIKKYDNIYGSVGIHPGDCEEIDDLYFDILEKYILDNKIVAIGEIGLDYYYSKENIDKQKEVFIKQLDLAVKYDLPVVIHSRDAFLDTYEILKKYKLRGVIHCFSYSKECASMFIELGYLLGIGGVITFKNSKSLVETIKSVDISKIVFETDSPYLSPEPFRGKKNSPCNIPIICKKVSYIKEVNEDIIKQAVYNNTINMFNIGE